MTLLEALEKRGAPKVDPKKLVAELKRNRIKPEPGVGAWLKADVTARRYGIALPAEVRELFKAADRYAIEDVEFPSYRYLRAAPQGWEIPGRVAGEPLLGTFRRRFEWNAFSNLQLWEHFAGLICIGWGGDGEDRVCAAMHEVEGAAPVFVIDHETSQISGRIARRLSDYLRVQFSPRAAIVPPAERSLILKPEHRRKYLEATGPLRLRPEFLEPRARWLVAALSFGDAKSVQEHLGLREAACFDADRELADVSKNVPLALYWIFRTYFLGEKDLFEEAERKAGRNPSPLVRSSAEVARQRWDSKDPKSQLVLMRAALKKAKLPRRAKWSRRFAVKDL